jgi:hypothetical protein
MRRSTILNLPLQLVFIALRVMISKVSKSSLALVLSLVTFRNFAVCYICSFASYFMSDFWEVMLEVSLNTSPLCILLKV